MDHLILLHISIEEIRLILVFIFHICSSVILNLFSGNIFSFFLRYFDHSTGICVYTIINIRYSQVYVPT